MEKQTIGNVSWERVALAFATVLVGILGYFGVVVQTDINRFRDTMVNLNDTMTEIKIQIAVNRNQADIISRNFNKRIEDTRHWVDKVSNRLAKLEREAGTKRERNQEN